MLFARRLIKACLALAVAGYGLVASAPAHAHAPHDGGSYAIHAVAVDVHEDMLSVGHALAGDHHHDVDAAHNDSDKGDADHQNGSQSERGIVFHAHAVAPFAPVEALEFSGRTAIGSVMRWNETSEAAVSGSFVPLLRPPRTFL